MTNQEWKKVVGDLFTDIELDRRDAEWEVDYAKYYGRKEMEIRARARKEVFENLRLCVWGDSR